MYNYLENVKEDIKEYLKNNYDVETVEEIEEIDKENLYDELFIADSVTGNGSGSYTFSTYEAEENICHNLELLKEALEEFGGDYGEALEKGAEYCDVTIRCYLLGNAIEEAIQELIEEVEEEEKEE